MSDRIHQLRREQALAAQPEARASPSRTTLTSNEIVNNVVDSVEEAINVTMDYFTPIPPSPVVTTAKFVIRKITFDESVPVYLREAYFLKEYLEHNYNEQGLDDRKNLRFKGKISVDIVGVKKAPPKTGHITITEKRGTFKRNIVKTYQFSNEDDITDFLKRFQSETINKKYIMLSGVKAAGGSVIKALIREDAYIDKYYNRIEDKPKFTWKKGLSNAITTIGSATTGAIVSIILLLL